MMGMRASRGVGGAGISAPTGPISGLGNVGQNSMNLSQASNISNAITQQLRFGQLSSAQAALMAAKLRMAQTRKNMIGGSKSGIGGMSGARQMHPGSTGLSMLGGPTLNRANINPMQRTGMRPMGPPKLMASMNLYMNLQQQQQHDSPRQMSQHKPMSPQLSSRVMHPMSTGNQEAYPASPQLSSQTLGSVGSITNSPMELQGVNKSTSAGN